MNLLDLLPQRLTAKRKECGLTLMQVGERTGLSISFLSDIERGKAHPSLESLVKLAACYQTSVAELCIEAEIEDYVKTVQARMLEKVIQELQDELRRITW